MNHQDPNFSIIIPNYNGAAFLPDCLKSIKESIKKCPSSNFEIIIIDNNSHDNSIDIIEKFHIKNLKIIKNKKNLGFATAINQGVNESNYEFVVPCNNDLTVEPNWFEIIARTIKLEKNPKTVVFFGTVLDKSGNFYESQGLKFYTRGKAENISNKQPFNKKELAEPYYVWGSSAALVVYNKSVLQKIGSFDDDFFAYEEDVDLALRFANLNYKTLYIPKAICYHLGSGTSNSMGNFRQRMDFKNWIYLIIKNYSSKDFFTNCLKIIEERGRNLSGLIKATKRLYGTKSIYFIPKAVIQTFGEILINLPKMIKKRTEINKLKRI